MISIWKFFVENSINQRKQLREDYDGFLLALDNTPEGDENRVNILDLAETKKYQLVVGIPEIDRGKAQYLLKQKDKTNKIYQYKRGSPLVEFSEVEDKFNYIHGFKTRWVRAIKKWGSLFLYGIFFCQFILFPVIMAFCSIGVYSVNGNVYDLYAVCAFGLMGYVMLKLRCEPAPLLLGFVPAR